MIKGWQRFLILLAVFVAGIYGFSKLTNRGARDLTTEMSKASIPVVCFVENGHRINELQGYADEMNGSLMGDSITPIGESYVVSMEVLPYESNITSIDYEIRSKDTKRLIQQSQAEITQKDDETISAELKIEKLLMQEETYLLVLQITTDEGSYQYYTNTLLEGNYYLDDSIEFAKEIHSITMDKDRQSELVTFMEPKSSSDNTNLHYVNIHNSLPQICWGELQGNAISEPVVTIQELGEDSNTLELSYVMESQDDSQKRELYNVREHYRVRKGEERMYLLDFQRTADEIFGGNSSSVAGNAVHLGIRSDEVDFKANEAGSIVCFVQQGDLWSFNTGTNMLTQIFSFRSSEQIDIRENYNDHDIRIVRVDDSGNVDFIVYGYMNRGDHEGRVGVSVCHFDSMTGTVEEQLFLPSTEPYQIMKEEIGRMMYITDKGMFFFVMGNEVMMVNLETKESKTFIDNLDQTSCQTSETGRYLAWLETDAWNATNLHITDFENEVTHDLSVDANLRVKPLGFLENDCVYGVASVDMRQENQEIFPMKRVEIVDSEHQDLEVQKAYEDAEAYIVEVEIKDGSVFMKRAIWEDGEFVPTDTDTIRNRDMQGEALVYLKDYISDRKQTEKEIRMPSEITGSVNVLIPKWIISESEQVVE